MSHCDSDWISEHEKWVTSVSATKSWRVPSCRPMYVEPRLAVSKVCVSTHFHSGPGLLPKTLSRQFLDWGEERIFGWCVADKNKHSTSPIHLFSESIQCEVCVRIADQECGVRASACQQQSEVSMFIFLVLIHEAAQSTTRTLQKKCKPIQTSSIGATSRQRY